jgi:thiosulfate/3-mercaptopyruvate sulfurtransferase
MLILDARSAERFRGENETLDPVGGHIPGAVNRFYFDNLDDDGCFFKPAAELRAEFAALLGGRPATQVVQQCGSGVTACHNLLAMELAGLSGSKLYPGILERVVRRSGATGGARLGFRAVAPPAPRHVFAHLR